VQASQNNRRLAFGARLDTEGVMGLQIAGQEIARAREATRPTISSKKRQISHRLGPSLKVLLTEIRETS
jgi:hypothetical protein